MYIWVLIILSVHLHWLERPAYFSALTYSSSTGKQGTLPTLTPIWISLNCRPRFSPRMVTLVPPCRGPVSGDSWVKDREKINKPQRRNYYVIILCIICTKNKEVHFNYQNLGNLKKILLISMCWLCKLWLNSLFVMCLSMSTMIKSENLDGRTDGRTQTDIQTDLYMITHSIQVLKRKNHPHGWENLQ